MDYLLNFYNSQLKPDTLAKVLNLIINGLPSKQLKRKLSQAKKDTTVLNLIINGLPSKPHHHKKFQHLPLLVLNLIINGLPSKLYN